MVIEVELYETQVIHECSPINPFVKFHGQKLELEIRSSQIWSPELINNPPGIDWH